MAAAVRSAALGADDADDEIDILEGDLVANLGEKADRHGIWWGDAV